jgi:hypothetical protein
LDARLRYAVSTERVVIIHGDSKQGKTWLRQHVLTPEECVTVQCQIGATPASILTQALGLLGVKATLRQTSQQDLEGSMEVSGSTDIGAKLIAKLGIQTRLKGTARRSSQQEVVPIGRTPGDLAWVAKLLRASEKRLVIEDFHYLEESSRAQFAFLLKALGDYDVHPVIIGVWSQDHLLTYYNGDLSGRIEDIHLVWSPAELEQVLRRGSEALNIAMSSSLRSELIRDAYGNVGTLQNLAEALCQEAGIFERQADLYYLGVGPALASSREAIARGMQPRFQGFADAYLAGLRELPHAERQVLHAVIALVCDRPDDELLHGVPVVHLGDARDEAGITHVELLRVLGDVDRFQAGLEISPLVMTFNRHAQSVCLIDRRFLFYRKYGTPRWPWHEPGFSA